MTGTGLQWMRIDKELAIKLTINDRLEVVSHKIIHRKFKQ